MRARGLTVAVPRWKAAAARGTTGREAGGRAGHPGSKGCPGRAAARGALWEVDAAPGRVGEWGGAGRVHIWGRGEATAGWGGGDGRGRGGRGWRGACKKRGQEELVWGR